jgi:hypothetical protein
MDRSALLLKKREISNQIEELKRKLVSIDDVISLFPDEVTPPLKGMGKYVSMGPTEAILDACGAVAPNPLTVATLENILLKEGMPTKSANLRTTIAGIADRLVAAGRLFKGTMGGQKAYYLTNEPPST